MYLKKQATILQKLVLFSLTILLASCGATREEVVYFQDTGDFETIVDNNRSSTKFKVDDVISIHVSSLDPEASAPFNLYRGQSEGGFRPEQVDYLIDQDGMIDFPVIGKVSVEGLSPDELRVLLRDLLSDYLKDPIINIRLRNFTITVLGAVNRPGTYPVSGERITVMEGLGLAGDLSLYAERTNVLVVRDFDGTKVYTRIDLTSKELAKSPVYYLTQNDVIYAEPNKAGRNATQIGPQTAIYVTLFSLFVTSAVLIITRR
ncbi:polysaccharide biosynthesis/export family protein [Eudoraea chungangensis]|uniref:polysaccharide biosynthesis/export family protein n=1 Tax=Eudoraea chungangensis TaxID=1481905 RepID=UPI0023EDD637|nr:polysaccharide biosynthesis/export family protein [Eudoraea chungangensis]